MKTINNKQYNECSVVMLTTDKAENSLLTSFIKGKIFHEKLYMTQEYLKSIDKKSYHLYILSDEEVKDGDWVCCSNGNIKQITKANIDDRFVENWKKIIATTDKSLHTGFAKTLCPNCGSKMKVNLPDHIECISCGQKSWNLVQGVYNEEVKLSQIPQSFIEYFVKQYNKGNVIDKVLVEYESKIAIDGHTTIGYELKINPDNTINILPQKDSWTREELQKLFDSYGDNLPAKIIWNDIQNL